MLTTSSISREAFPFGTRDSFCMQTWVLTISMIFYDLVRVLDGSRAANLVISTGRGESRWVNTFLHFVLFIGLVSLLTSRGFPTTPDNLSTTILCFNVAFYVNSTDFFLYHAEFLFEERNSFYLPLWRLLSTKPLANDALPDWWVWTTHTIMYLYERFLLLLSPSHVDETWKNLFLARRQWN